MAFRFRNSASFPLQSHRCDYRLFSERLSGLYYANTPDTEQQQHRFDCIVSTSHFDFGATMQECREMLSLLLDFTVETACTSNLLFDAIHRYTVQLEVLLLALLSARMFVSQSHNPERPHVLHPDLNLRSIHVRYRRWSPWPVTGWLKKDRAWGKPRKLFVSTDAIKYYLVERPGSDTSNKRTCDMFVEINQRDISMSDMRERTHEAITQLQTILLLTGKTLNIGEEEQHRLVYCCQQSFFMLHIMQALQRSKQANKEFAYDLMIPCPFRTRSVMAMSDFGE